MLCLQHPQKKECDADFSTTRWPPVQSSRQKPRQGRNRRSEVWLKRKRLGSETAAGVVKDFGPWMTSQPLPA